MHDPPARPPIAHAPVSAVLLAERDADATAAALAAWRGVLAGLRRDYEIVLLRPAQPTGAAEPFGTAYRVCRYDASVGYGPALQTAITLARHPLLAFGTADGQYRPADLAAMLPLIDKGDLVLGYRAHRPIPAWRKALDASQRLAVRVLLGDWTEPRRHWLGVSGWRRRWAARWLFGLRVADPECAFRLVRRELLDGLPLQSRGPFVQVELLAKLNFLPCVLAGEVPVAWTPPPGMAEPAAFAAEARALFRRPEFRASIAPRPAER